MNALNAARPNMATGMLLPGAVGGVPGAVGGVLPGATAGVAAAAPPLVPDLSALQATLAAGSFQAALTGAQPAQNLMALTRRARRIHVGNLPTGTGLTTDMIKHFFNAAVTSAVLHDTSIPGDPITDVVLGSEGKFGFLEFRTIAEATS
jgi:hypothetical protein